MRTRRRRPARWPYPKAARGFSLVELMVGSTVALWLLLGAIQLMGHHLASYRAQVRELRMNQELRAAIDVMARDIKRAGHWSEALAPFAADDVHPTPDNPFADIRLDTASVASSVEYAYDRSAPTAPTAFGFRWLVASNRMGMLQMKNAAGGWQPLTDPAVVNITGLAITPLVRTVELWPNCPCRFLPVRPVACEDAELRSSVERPRLQIRRLEVVVTGSAPGDSKLVRVMQEHIHLRNAMLIQAGACPKT